MSDIDSQLSARVLARYEVNGRLWRDVAAKLQAAVREDTQQPMLYDITLRLAGMVQPEVVREDYQGANYRMQARLTVDTQALARDVAAVGRDRALLRMLEQRQHKAEEAIRALRPLQSTLRSSAPPVDKFALQQRYAEHVRTLAVAEGVAAAMAAIKAERYTQAIGMLNALRMLEPQYAAVYLHRGRAYGAAGMRKKALADFAQALELDTHSALPYHYRGVFYNSIAHSREAVADFTRAIEREPHFVMAYYNRGAVYQQLRESKRALADFTQVIALNPDDAGAYNNRGVSYSMQGERDKALQDFTTAIKLQPTHALAYYNRGRIFDKEGQVHLALYNYDEALTHDPNFVGAYFHRGQILQAQGHYDRAVQDYAKMVELNPSHPEAYYLRGRAQLALGNVPLAVEDYLKAVQLGSRSLVREMQSHLRATQFLQGKVDGVFGPQTGAALKQYQAARGLPQTGVPDMMTLRVFVAERTTASKRAPAPKISTTVSKASGS
jgi:tetratricopeptide (TPR) repeat protein